MNTRKETPKTALPRIYFIDRRIASGSYPNTRQLALEYETSPSTISRDIDFMRARLDTPIAYDHQRNGYYYTEKPFGYPPDLPETRTCWRLAWQRPCSPSTATRRSMSVRGTSSISSPRR
jgi:hypothetical protein